MPRFMLFMYPSVSTEGHAGGPSLNAYNGELTRAGALLAADGLHPEAARVSASGVTDGPFSEAKELIGGYWIIQAKDREEAVEWARRCPMGAGPFIEVRQIYELSEFPEDIHAAAELSSPPPHQTSA